MLPVIIWYLFVLVYTVYTSTNYIHTRTTYILYKLQMLHCKSCCARLGLTQAAQCWDKSAYGRFFSHMWPTLTEQPVTPASARIWFPPPFFCLLFSGRNVSWWCQANYRFVCLCVARLLQLPANTFMYNSPLLPCTQEAGGPVMLLWQIFPQSFWCNEFIMGQINLIFILSFIMALFGV